MTDRSIAFELWNQSDTVLRSAGDYIKHIDTSMQLISDSLKAQQECAKRLRKMVVPFSKAQGVDSTVHASLTNFVQLFGNVGSVYENSAKEIQTQVISSMKTLHDNQKKEYDGQRAQLTKLTTHHEGSRKLLEASWIKYFNAFRDKQKAFENHERADKDMTLARIDQQKFMDVYNRKAQTYDQVMAQYADDLIKYNNANRLHYSKHIVGFLEDIDISNRNCMRRLQELLLSFIDLNTGAITKLIECNDSATLALSSIDLVKDSTSMVNRLQSTDMPPVDLPFVRLDTVPSKFFEGHPSLLGAYMLGVDNPKSCQQLGPTTGGPSLGGGRRGELRSPFICELSLKPVKEEDLLIAQLADRMKDMTDQLISAEGERDGLSRMVEVYEKNKNLGNSQAVKPKEEALNRRICSIQNCITKLKNRYVQLGGDQSLSQANAGLTQRNQPGETSSGSLQRSDCGSSVQRKSRISSGTYDSDNSFDSDAEEPSLINLSVSTPALNQSPTAAPKYVGVATAKYAYEGNGPSYLAAREGERFFVVERDTNNTGWTTVVSEDGSRSGYVPTSFIEVALC